MRTPEETKEIPRRFYDEVFNKRDLKYAEASISDNVVERNPQRVVGCRQLLGALRDAGKITLPTTVAEELATNPFVRAPNVEELARLRRDKDSFRS